MKPGLRIAYCPDVAGIGVDSEIDRICRKAAFDLAEDGATVEQIEFDLAFARPAFIRLRGQYMVDRHLDKLDKLDKLNPNLAGNIRAGLAQSPRDIALGEQGRTQLFERFRQLFETCDLLLTPCTAVPPFPVERNYPETINGKPMATYIDWVAPTFVVTLAGRSGDLGAGRPHRRPAAGRAADHRPPVGRGSGTLCRSRGRTQQGDRPARACRGLILNFPDGRCAKPLNTLGKSSVMVNCR